MLLGRYTALILVGLLLAACTPHPTLEAIESPPPSATPPSPSPTSGVVLPTATPTPTVTPSATLPPVSATSPPTRTWPAGPVLLAFGTFFENPAPSGVSRTPDVLLYSDGRLIVRQGAGFQEAQLSRRETCALLNTIDRVGFFDVDLKTYDEQLDALPLGVVSVTVVEVNGWRQRRVVAEALFESIDSSDVQVPPALEAVYRLLLDYQPADLQPYRYDHLGLTIHQVSPDFPYQAETAWPLTSPSLGALFEEAEREGVENREEGFGLLLEGEVAENVYQALRQTSAHSFVEDRETYILDARPLLPYESLASAVAYETEIPSPGVPTGTVEWTCYSSDGVLEIP